MKNLLKGKKTYLIALVSALYGVVVYGLQDHNWYGVAKFVLAGSGAAALRAAITKVEVKVDALLSKELPAPIAKVAEAAIDSEVAKVEGQ